MPSFCQDGTRLRTRLTLRRGYRGSVDRILGRRRLTTAAIRIETNCDTEAPSDRQLKRSSNSSGAGMHLSAHPCGL